jgi:hypothetical protein
MQAKGGEEVISHPDLGNISLIYGDRQNGLEHIATRRGADFLNRIPDLLAAGALRFRSFPHRVRSSSRSGRLRRGSSWCRRPRGGVALGLAGLTAK